MLKYFKAVKRKKAKIMVCAPSNIVVDKIADRLHDLGMKVTRVMSVQYESASLCKKEVKLSYQMMKFEEELNSDEVPVNYDRALENFVLESTDVICCTCSASLDERLRHLRFDVVIMDEASFATEPLCLQAFCQGAKRVVLIGDPKQLRPIVISKSALAEGLGVSMFERLMNRGYPIQTLNIQYRMSPTISSFPLQYFYKDRLQDGVTKEQRTMTELHDLPTGVDQTCFFHCDGEELVYRNLEEAEKLTLFVRYLIKKKRIQPEKIGVVTFYNRQKKELINRLSFEFPGLEIKTVDGYQGSEKDIIVVSCVRTEHIGFVCNLNRLNVMMTRARCGLFIFGNADFLARQKHLRKLLKYYDDQKWLYKHCITSKLGVHVERHRIPRT
eukprot:TRINITY_DN1922_c0_g2_i10.p1 TRINITY_DN1922_c0_g2~~TRINITY_DN1922_c0_g2_i10.p1  ORF type:complete len:385 (+),score=50.51 TRINITY_DN1922_c0_g2_i10:29-1183(+)